MRAEANQRFVATRRTVVFGMRAFERFVGILSPNG
jgi:hypothetical protein